MASLSASEIQSQLTSLKEAARSRSPGELGRVDQVVQPKIGQIRDLGNKRDPVETQMVKKASRDLGL